MSNKKDDPYAYWQNKMSSGKKQATGKGNADIEHLEEISGDWESGSEVKMSDIKDDEEDEYSMTMNNEDDFQVSTSFK